MKRFIQFTPLFIRHFTTSEWPFPVHNHNHVELMFIHRGQGVHQLNGKDTAYKGKSLFLLAPDDGHLFDIESETEFSVLKFSYQYLTHSAQLLPSNNWNLLLDQLFVAKERHNPLILEHAQLLKLEGLFRLMIQEWQENDEKITAVLSPLLQSILLLLQNSSTAIPKFNSTTTQPLCLSIAQHLHEFITYPEKLNLRYLAQRFKLSPTHLSRRFKTDMGISIKRYTDEYKYKLIENRLLYSQDLIKEISAEFGFTDVSHFNKFIQVQSGGNSPKQLRVLPH